MEDVVPPISHVVSTIVSCGASRCCYNKVGSFAGSSRLSLNCSVEWTGKGRHEKNKRMYPRNVDAVDETADEIKINK